MADKTIGELPAASEVYDDSLLVMEQQGEARSVQGALIKKYAREATAAYVEEARKSAEEGKGYRDAAAESARDAADVALHPPILKEENDHWWIWDTDLNDYKDSGIDAGVSLEVVEEIITGEPGTPASVANLGTKTDPRLQFTIPEGKKGDKGDAATIEVGEVTTGEPGTSASVKNSGSSSAAKLDFVIPQGATGRGFTILGRYDSLDELNTAVQDPSVGDAYQVGTEKPYDVYIYDAEEGWVNSGPINVDLPPHLIVGEDSELGTVLPVDADTLQGHPADYFASKSSMDTELGKKQDVLPYYSNRNLLDNAFWGQKEAIINQRRQTEYAANTSTIDRWYLHLNNNIPDAFVRIEDDGIVIHGVDWAQHIDKNIVPLKKGQVYTASALTADGQLATYSGEYNDDHKNYTLNFPDVPELVLNLRFEWGNLGFFGLGCVNEIKLVAAKLELGPQQTLAHKEGDTWVLNEIPDYVTELAKCQRYYVTSPDLRASGYIIDQYTIRVSISLPECLRATPTVGNINVAQIFSNGKVADVSSFTIKTSTPYMITNGGNNNQLLLTIAFNEPLNLDVNHTCVVFFRQIYMSADV